MPSDSVSSPERPASQSVPTIQLTDANNHNEKISVEVDMPSEITHLNNQQTSLEQLDLEIENELQRAGLVEPPDGGYGWVIVAASFLANCIVDGVIYTAGQGFAPGWEKEYGASSGATAWVVSLLSGCYLLVGPIVSALANLFGCRVVAVAGSAIAITGFLLSLLAPNLIVLYITFGVMGGVGFGMVYLPSVVIVSYYFKDRRALATGIAVCGSGIGMFVFAPIISWLQQLYTWQQTLMLIAALTMHLFVCAALYRPLTPTSKQIDRVAELALKYEEAVLSDLNLDQHGSITGPGKLLRDDTITSELIHSPHVHEGVMIERFDSGARRGPSQATPFKSALELRARHSKSMSLQMGHTQTPFSQEDLLAVSKQTVNSLNRPLTRRDLFYTGSSLSLAVRQKAHPKQSVFSLVQAESELGDDIPEEGGISELLMSGLRAMVDVRLLKSPSFMLLASTGFLTMAGFFVPFVFLARAAVAAGHSEADSALLISVLGVVNIVARIFTGFVGGFGCAAIAQRWLSDQPRLDALWIHNGALLMAGLGTCCVPFLTEYWMFCVYCCVFGFGTACFASLRSIICVELLGLERLSNAFGVLLLFMGVAALIGAPLAGTIADMTGRYDESFYVMGAIMALSGLLGFPLRAISKWENNEDDNNDEEVEEKEAVNEKELVPSDSTPMTELYRPFPPADN